MKLLVTGSSGLLHKYFFGMADDSTEIAILSRSRPEYAYKFYRSDIRDLPNVRKIVSSVKPDVIVHAAGISDIDTCQKNKALAIETNIVASLNLTEAARTINAKFVYLSSSNVYGGESKTYNEKSQRNPANFYAYTKKVVEDYVRDLHNKYAVVRFTNLYGIPPKNSRTNLVKSLFIHGTRRRTLNCVSDRYTNFLYAGDAAKLLWRVVKSKNGKESVNFGGQSLLSFYEFACMVKEALHINNIILNPVKFSALEGRAPRAKVLRLSNSLAKKQYGVSASSFEESMKDVYHQK